MHETYQFVFTVALPLVVYSGKTMWKLSANTYGNGHCKFDIVAECIHGRDTRIMILDGREAPTMRDYQLGTTCERGAMLDRIVRKLVREERAEIVCH